MKRLTFSILGILVLAGFAAAQPAKAAGEDVAAALKGLEEKWEQAQLKGDAAALGALLANGFVSTSNTGEVHNKTETLDRLKSGALKLRTEKGKPFDEAERFTDTWVKRAGQWRCVASQGTLIKKK
ncbi:MAG: nuclear transport factor 2 family protein [Acidobacteria bacterium]|nr:nuclear transport factor 2 family protein [Acidobacteriota bacterium]